MNIRSVKFRLSLWYFLTFVISSGFIFGSFYLITRQTLLSQIDEEISKHGARVLNLIDQEMIGTHQKFPREQLKHEFSDMPGMLVVILDKNSGIISSSQNIDFDTPAVKDFFEKSANVIKPIFVERLLGSIHMRLEVFPLIKDGVIENLILVGHPLDVVTNSLNNLANKLIWVFLFSCLLSFMGGFMVSKGALRPIAIFSSKLKKISVTNLSQQIEVFHTGDELEELSQSFNTLLSNLSASFEREHQFIGDVAHELRTPLSILKNLIEVTLSKDRNQDDYKQTLSEIVADVNNLSATVNDIMDLAWAQVDRQAVKNEQIDLTDMVKELAEIAHQIASDKKIRVVEKISNKVNVLGVQQKLFRALFNLVENAVKYTLANGWITISLYENNGAAIFEITNTGVGISEEELPHVFDRFYRGEKSKLTFGSGLGLAICKSIVEAHKGTIFISSEPKGTTTVTVSLEHIPHLHLDKSR